MEIGEYRDNSLSTEKEIIPREWAPTTSLKDRRRQSVGFSLNSTISTFHLIIIPASRCFLVTWEALLGSSRDAKTLEYLMRYELWSLHVWPAPEMINTSPSAYCGKAFGRATILGLLGSCWLLASSCANCVARRNSTFLLGMAGLRPGTPTNGWKKGISWSVAFGSVAMMNWIFWWRYDEKNVSEFVDIWRLG